MSTPSHRYGVFDFSAYIVDRVDNFTGRTWVFQEIDRWLRREDGERYFLVTGEPGRGKSAVAARLAQFSAGEVLQSPTCHCFTPGFLRAVHFCRAAASDWVDPPDIFSILALQLTNIDEFKRALKDVGDRDINIDVQIQAGTVQPGRMNGAIAHLGVAASSVGPSKSNVDCASNSAAMVGAVSARVRAALSIPTSRA